jgi:hypothetical protein
VLPVPVDPGGDPFGHRSIHSDIVTLDIFLTILLGDESGRAGSVDCRLIPTDACESCEAGEGLKDEGSGLEPLDG